MAAKDENKPTKNETTVERKSDRELVVRRTFNGPVSIVFKAWATADLFQQWWAPKSFGLTLLSCEMDIRTGGSYRIEMGHASSDKPMTFFGRYLEVIPNAKIVWTNDEGGEDNGAVTTVTFEDRGETTLVVLSDLYPTKEALDEAIASQATSGFPEQFEQLDSMLAA